MTDELRASAKELIARLGGGAIAYMEKRITEIQATGDARELDQAYRLLTEVENQLSKGS